MRKQEIRKILSAFRSTAMAKFARDYAGVEYFDRVLLQVEHEIMARSYRGEFDLEDGVSGPPVPRHRLGGAVHRCGNRL